MDTRRFGAQDRFIGEIDKVIKNLTLRPQAARAAPEAPAAEALDEAERAESVRLMRVNQIGRAHV